MRMLLVLSITAVITTPLFGQPAVYRGREVTMQLSRAAAQLSAADDALAALQTALERDAAILARLREARQMLEEETQPMTVVNAVHVRVSEVQQMRPPGRLAEELTLIMSTLDDYRRSSANISLPRLVSQLDTVVGMASDIVVDDVRDMQPALTALTRMQEALQTRVSAIVQAQGRAMEMTAARTGH